MGELSESDVRSLKFLRLLVTVLTTVMIVGFIVLIGFLVTRFPDRAELSLPDQINLPDGSTPVAFTRAADWFAVVTGEDEILIYNLAGGLRQRISLTAEE